MDNSNIPTYPGRPAEEDLNPIRQDSLEHEENRLNTSRENLRQLLTSAPSSDTNHKTSKTDSEQQDPDTIDSWSSLLASWVVPAAKDSAGRHPYTLLLGSALAGAYFARSKPLRNIVGSVIVGTIVRNLVNASIDAGSRNGGRILRDYLKRKPQKKYPDYKKQEHETVDIDGY